MKDTLRRVGRKVGMIPISIMGFLRKDYTLLFRKKKYLYLSILLPLLIGLIYIFTLTETSGGLTLMVCDQDDTKLTDEVLRSMNGFTITVDREEDCIDRLKEEIRMKHYLFGAVIEEGFTKDLENLNQAHMVVYYDNSEPAVSAMVGWKIDVALTPFKSQLVMALAEELKDESGRAREKIGVALDVVSVNSDPISKRLSSSIRSADENLERLEGIEPAFLASPIVVAETGVHKTVKLIDIGIAPLYVILSMFLLLMLCSTGVIYDRKVGLFSRIRASNSSMLSYIAAKLVFFFSISVVQFLVILLIFVGFGAGYDVSVSLLLKALVFITLVNTLLGFLIALVSESEGVAVLISLIITLPLLFLSGMFYPLELMPKLVQWGAFLLPLNTEVLMLKQALLFGGSIANSYFLIPLGIFLVVIYFLRKR
ncbi:ABC transporter permease [Thermoproteota archaeon]